MSDILTLSLCPFCGKAPRIYTSGLAYYIECTNAACAAMPSTSGYVTEGGALTAWNTRAPAVIGEEAA